MGMHPNEFDDMVESIYKSNLVNLLGTAVRVMERWPRISFDECRVEVLWSKSCSFLPTHG